MDEGHSFLVRVGGNVRLLKNLGTARQHNGLVYLWPNEVARKKEPPIILRLLEFQGPRGNIYLVTNVLSESDLSAEQAGQLYTLRWGVELQFRSFKQTFQRGKLRSRTSENALAELNWSLIGLSLIQLFAVKEQIKVGSPPAQSSVALALSVIQGAMRNWSKVADNSESLEIGLRASTKDQYERSSDKRARYRPHKKDPPSATKPIVVAATPQQRREYHALATAA